MTARERRTLLIAAAVVAAVVVAGLTIWAMTSHSSNYDRSHDGCVNLTFASSMGGSVEHACGQAAIDWCQAVSQQQDAHALAVRTECRRAGLLN